MISLRRMYATARSVPGKATSILLTYGFSKDETEKQVSAGQERQTEM